MKIGLYFGSFNPIHVGHLIIASYIAQNGGVDQVWLVVSPQNPFKNSSSLLNEYHRLHLAQLAIENNPLIKVCDIEFKLPKPSYTIDTLVYLEEKYPHNTFSIIMGSDGFNNIDKWKNIDVLKNKYEFIVYPRSGFVIENIEGFNLKTVAAPLLNISSTEIRKNIKAGKSIRYLVPDKVLEEIEMGRYYK
jgi:nicotinate (nicotinamide) nucleotide adenylyltransferase